MPVKGLDHVDVRRQRPRALAGVRPGRFGPLGVGRRTATRATGHGGDHERCVKLGVNVQFPPAEDRDIPGYWELFVLDPDGLRIEVAHYPPQDSH